MFTAVITATDPGNDMPRVTPLESPTQITDPVCGMTVDIEQAFSKIEHSGKAYYFCSESCFTRFVAEPEMYASLRVDD